MNQRDPLHDGATDNAAEKGSKGSAEEFLERMAHELRGAASVTLGALDEIERALGDKAELRQPFLQMARRGVNRILRTADLLSRHGA